MKFDKIQIKAYPQPNPKVKGSGSRFAVRRENDQDILEEADPDYPICDFSLDPETGFGVFVQRSDNQGKPLFEKGRPMAPYLPAPELIELVRLSQVLQRPVLVKGEPGSGKTQLARSVAYEWYGAEYKKHFFEWSIKSTSRAVDGLYSFDHIARLRNAQLASLQGIRNQKEDLRIYRTFGPMAQAFLTSTTDKPSILLIDEIDKADVDFANDLLLELDERRFMIPDSETGERIEARYPPLIFITSNDERELPEAFLRRCIFLYIDFPDDDQLKRIIDAHLPGLSGENSSFVSRAIQRFRDLRTEINKDPSDSKRVSTSELLDYLTGYDFDIKSGNKERLEKDLQDLPFYHHSLLKSYAAVKRREKQIEEQKEKQKSEKNLKDEH